MHLVVIQHGLWGAPGNTAYLSMKLREQLKEGHFVLNSDVNIGNLTYDGIDVCGDRLHALVLATIEELARKNSPVRAISMVGYSMGGLINRYVAGKLYAEGLFDIITPVNFITVATPHLGAWRMPSTWYNRAFNYMVPVVTSRSGYQLVLQDKHLWGKPLLCLMSHPDLLFMRALRRFRKLMLLANIFHDRPVPYCTAAARLDNPYESTCPVPVDPKYPSIVTTAAAAAAAAAASKAAAAPADGATSCSSNSTPGGGAKRTVQVVAEGTAAAATAVVAGAAAASEAVLEPGGGGATAGPDAADAVDGGDGGGGGGDTPHALRQDQHPVGPAQSQQQQSPQQSHPQEQQQDQQLPQQHPHPQQQRPLRSTYMRLLLVLFLPLAIPALLFMVISGRSHHSKMRRTALDFSWIQRHHDRQQQHQQHHEQEQGAAGSSGARGAAGDAASGDETESPQEAVRLLVSPDGGQTDVGGSKPAGGGGSGGSSKREQHHHHHQHKGRPAAGSSSRPLSDIECPSAPDLPAIAATSAVLAQAAASGAPLGGGRYPGALDAGDDEVIVSEQTVLLHDGIVEVPEEMHRVQEWIVEKLNTLPWHKVDVDCRDYHAHAAIVVRNPARFRHCADVVDYLCDHFVRLPPSSGSATS